MRHTITVLGRKFDCEKEAKLFAIQKSAELSKNIPVETTIGGYYQSPFTHKYYPSK